MGNESAVRESRVGTLLVLLVCLALIAGACSTPIGVKRVDPRTVHHQLTSYVLSTGELSAPTLNVLHQLNLFERFEDKPETALAALHDKVATDSTRGNELFALAELSFLHAERTGKRSSFLASAVYAYAYLFPGRAGDPPNPFDPRLRAACDLYNRGLTEGFASLDGAEVELRSGTYELPFGELVVQFDAKSLRWGDRELSHFIPVAELEVHGLRNRYRRPGIGAPLAAGMIALHAEEGFQVAPNLKVPVTALLRIEQPRRQLAEGRVHASLSLYNAYEVDSVLIGGRRVPLEVEPTSSLAYSLNESPVWERELKGFFLGDLATRVPTQLVGLEPYRPGRFPVVLVHGTASIGARWAELANDLLNDPRLRGRIQFWIFNYDTGSPIAYSAMLLRELLQETVKQLDPEGRDVALRQMVIIGHSQGGLLARMTSIDSGSRLWDMFSREPLEELTVSEETRDLLRRALFIKPLPFIRRLVFIATPHRGSYVAGSWLAHKLASLVKLPGIVTTAVADTILRDPEALALEPERLKIVSVYAMTPGSPLMKALAPIPIAPGVATHSIIAVKGDGPVEEGSDGVVKYSSAHLDGVDSELVVRSGHSVQSHPDTIEEVRRILREHAGVR